MVSIKMLMSRNEIPAAEQYFVDKDYLAISFSISASIKLNRLFPITFRSYQSH
jgi:hypothetical protein